MNRARWLTAYEASVRATSVGCKLVRQELVEMQAADGSEFLETIYDDLLAALQPGGRLDFGNEVDSPE